MCQKKSTFCKRAPRGKHRKRKATTEYATTEYSEYTERKRLLGLTWSLILELRRVVDELGAMLIDRVPGSICSVVFFRVFRVFRGFASLVVCLHLDGI